MTREQFAHVLRVVSRIADDPDVLVIGSQSILGSYSEDELPLEATGSMEVDTTFLSDPEDAKSGLVDAMIGELSSFHNEFGYYPQGVSIGTGIFRQAGRIASSYTRRRALSPAGGYAWSRTTASWPSSSDSTRRIRTSPSRSSGKV